ncbi:hypothetical protein COBT_002552, partial [Conglomerata obtusa]
MTTIVSIGTVHHYRNIYYDQNFEKKPVNSLIMLENRQYNISEGLKYYLKSANSTPSGMDSRNDGHRLNKKIICLSARNKKNANLLGRKNNEMILIHNAILVFFIDNIYDLELRTAVDGTKTIINNIVYSYKAGVSLYAKRNKRKKLYI